MGLALGRHGALVTGVGSGPVTIGAGRTGNCDAGRSIGDYMTGVASGSTQPGCRALRTCGWPGSSNRG
jgi:hypothetical protein